ncbi:hypothetical protein TNCV_2297061 [Trichonephila clavipes]|nr:hypothetical protein TNCV_2297061 [Trichonephila clavipes]
MNRLKKLLGTTFVSSFVTECTTVAGSFFTAVSTEAAIMDAVQRVRTAPVVVALHRCTVCVDTYTANQPTSGLKIRNVALRSCKADLRRYGSSRSLVAGGRRDPTCQVIYSQFGLAIHENDHQARRRFVEWVQNEIAVVPDFHKRILFSDEAHFWSNGYVNKQNCRIWSEANPQVYVETPLHPEKLTVWCALWAGGILLQKR